MRPELRLSPPVLSRAAHICIGVVLAAALLCVVPGCRCESGPPRGTLGTITLSTRGSDAATPAQEPATTDGGDDSATADGGSITSDGGTLPTANR